LPLDAREKARELVDRRCLEHIDFKTERLRGGSRIPLRRKGFCRIGSD
jgi:hypothetical protein